MLPPADHSEDGRQKMKETVAAGPAVIQLKETLARRLSSSMDCIDAASAADNDEKLAAASAAAAASTAATATVTSESQLDADEPATGGP